MTTPLDIQGLVLEKGSSEYETARTKGFAVNGHHSFPAIIAQPATKEDVQECIRYAKTNDMTVTVRSGGHNWYGTFLRDDVLMIDMSSFDDFSVDSKKEQATVGPCTTGNALVEAAEKYGLHFPIGHCYGVPLGGYLLGGGLGWMLDYYGLACDYVLSAQVVTPDGDLMTVIDETHGQDWMYLLRGAASAFPGVVVSITIQLLKIPPIFRSAMMFYPVSAYVPLCTYLHKERSAKRLSNNLELASILGDRPPPLAEMIPDDKICILMVNAIVDSEEEFESVTAFMKSKEFADIAPFFPSPLEDTSISKMVVGFKDAYPNGWHWNIRHYISKNPPFAALSESFEAYAKTAPPGSLSLLSTFTVNGIDLKNPGVARVGGCVIGSECRYQEENIGDKTMEEYSASVDKLMAPLLVHYNPLEFPVEKSTFSQCWEDTEKLQEVRSKLDPEGRFFDPSKSPLSSLNK